jgi:hypothetical protein
MLRKDARYSGKDVAGEVVAVIFAVRSSALFSALSLHRSELAGWRADPHSDEDGLAVVDGFAS